MNIVRIGNSTLYNSDCMEVFPQISGKVDAIITDPPYAVPTIIAQSRSKLTKNLGDLSVVETAMRVYISECSKLLKPTGRMFIFCDGVSYPVIFRVLYPNYSTALLVWDKERFGMGREFRKSHELIIHAWRPDTPIFSNGVGVSDIIKCPPVPTAKRVHPAEKPLNLLKSLIQNCGDVIFDPFMGSGSTGVAALQAGKKFIGAEIEPDYFEAARSKIYESLELFELVKEQP